MSNFSKYSFRDYINPERWISFYHQLDLVFNCAPKKMLEVGKGSGVLENYLKKRTDIKYQSLDLDPELRPDVVGSVTQIPAKDKSFDLIAAFEVLEHLPFSDFELALSELKRVTRSDVVISLPDSRPHLRFSGKIPFLPAFQFAMKLPFPRRHRSGGEHFWEIGEWGYGNRKIIGILEKNFTLVKHFIPYGNQYHHFYWLKKNN